MKSFPRDIRFIEKKLKNFKILKVRRTFFFREPMTLESVRVDTGADVIRCYIILIIVAGNEKYLYAQVVSVRSWFWYRLFLFERINRKMKHVYVNNLLREDGQTVEENIFGF